VPFVAVKIINLFLVLSVGGLIFYAFDRARR